MLPAIVLEGCVRTGHRKKERNMDLDPSGASGPRLLLGSTPHAHTFNPVLWSQELETVRAETVNTAVRYCALHPRYLLRNLFSKEGL